MAGSKEKG